MRLTAITATASADGNRIALSWTNPDPASYPGIRVVRRKHTFPVAVHDGVVVLDGTDLHDSLNSQGEALHSFMDKNLQGETCYYYSLFPFQGDPPAYVADFHNRCHAMATSPFGFAARMYDQLPRIYHRYDTVLPDNPAEVVEHIRESGQLRRFVDVPGSILDQFYSSAKACLDLHNLQRLEGNLLPLLAQWIGWQLDFRLEFEAQRNEVRNAPHLYKTVGLIPTVEATVKRLINWESRIKEFVHNIFLSNNPERLNIWAMRRDESDQWQEERAPISLNFAYEGSPATVTLADGTIWLFYHTQRKDRWHIWFKTYNAVSGWSPSAPLSEGRTIEKHPTAVLQGTTLWLFWSSYDEEEESWRILYKTMTDGQWSDIMVFRDSSSQRKSPVATVDASGGLWLFWQEKSGSRWQMHYNRHDGSTWQLEPPALFPQDGGQDVIVESIPSALFQTSGGPQRIVLFWAQREDAGAGQKRWSLAYRVKTSIDPFNSGDWDSVEIKSKALAETNESDPIAVTGEGDLLQIFFSSDHSGSWAIWQTDLDISSGSWGTDSQIGDSPFTERYPLPMTVNGEQTLLYRSNKHLQYTSDVYKATETFDLRYAGSVSAVADNIAKNALHGTFNDFQAYTSDVGLNGKMTDSNWYSRETMGIYLTPDTEDPGLILRNQKVLRGVLHQFIPIQTRYVFIIEPAVYTEKIYTYDFPLDEEQRHIGEEFTDSLTTVSPEIYSGLSDSYTDHIPEWRWLRSWSTDFTEGGSVDFSGTPPNTHFRTWHIGVTGGDE